MGSLGSRPSVPAPQPQVVYVPAPSSTASSTSASQSASESSSAEAAANAEREARTSSLLQRERGRFGTITTSFRGLLGLSNNDGGSKKTLLGE
ncbi:MAG: hypothetical protein KDJ35_02610 [Alphaproteobacteria bacterium]|nr:hypothetical protein [Alphaproteobacteria bacterium]